MLPDNFIAPAINKRQKNIVNPAPGRYSGDDGKRKGRGYDYNSDRNKFIQQGIHHLYTAYGVYPTIGSTLNIVGPVSENDSTFTRQDAQAYSAVYPQNSYVTFDVSAPSGTYEMRQPSNIDAWTELELNTRIPSVKKLLSITSPESQKPEFQTDMTKANTVLTGSTAVAQLPSFEIQLPQGRIQDLETCFNNSLGSAVSISRQREEVEDVIIFKQPDDIDFEDWTKNVNADRSPSVLYNNPKEENFYFVSRITDKNPDTYDISVPTGLEARRTYAAEALAEIAFFANRVLPDDTSSLLEQVVVEASYGPPDRPNPPPNSTTWRLAGRVSAELIRELDTNYVAGALIPHISKAFADFMSWSNIERKTVFRYGDFKKFIRQTERALVQYNKVLSDEGITPDMLRGLELEREAVKLSSFPGTLNRLLDANNINSTAASDLVEISFDQNFIPKCIIYNGEIKTKGLGYSFKEEGVIEHPREGNNVMRDVSPTTFGYVFYSRDIILDARNKKDPVPWTEFIPSYTFPNPCVKPTEIQNALKKKEKERSKKDNLSAKDKLFKTDSEVTSQTLKALALTEKAFYNAVTSTLGECDTAQTTLLKDAMLVYNTIYGKSSPKKLAIRSAVILRDQLLERKIIEKELAADAETLIEYAARPHLILREVEKEVNDALFCLFGALGEAIVEQVLDPLGASPSAKQLARDVTTTARPSLRFEKGSTTDFFKVWRKQVEKLLIQFIYQLILSIFKDILKAALGCGPEESDKTAGSPKKLRSAYGAIQINDLVDQKGDIDLVKVASDNGILNKKKDANEEIVKVDATKEQLRQFNKDTSDILMPDETVGLLDRQSPERTRAIIEEVVFGANREKSETPIDRLLNEESLNAGDEKYATLTITKDTMASYYGAIGDLLGDLVTEVLEDLSSEDEYCDPRIEDPSNNFGGVSNAQAQEQVRQQIDAIINKVDQLCEITSDDFNFGLDLKKFEDLLAPPQFYLDFLDALRSASNRARDAIAKALSSNNEVPSIARPAQPPAYTETELWQNLLENPNYAANEYLRPRATKDGVDGKFKELTYKFGGIGSNQKYIELSWNADGATLQIGRSGERADSKVRDSERVIAKCRPADTNAPSLEDPYNIKTGLYPINFSSQNTPNVARNLNSIYTTGNASVQNRLRELQHTLTNNTYGPSVGNWDSTNIDRLVNVHGGSKDDYNFVQILANNSEKINYNVRGIYLLQDVAEEGVAETAAERLNEFIKIIHELPFEPNGDPCYDTDEEIRARAMADSIQAHLINFFLNIIPLFRVYHGWQTPDTLNLLAGYMFYKLKLEATADGIFPFYIAEMENFTDVFSRTDQESRGFTDINLKQFDDPYEQLRYYLRQSIQEMLKRAAESPINFATDTSFFETPYVREKYHKLSDYFKRGFIPVEGARGKGASAAIENSLPFESYNENNYPASIFPTNNSVMTLSLISNRFNISISELIESNSQIQPFLGDQELGPETRLDQAFNVADPFAVNLPADRGILENASALNNLPNSGINGTTNDTFAKRDFLNFVPLPYILAAYAVYFDRIVNIKSRTIATKFYAYRRVAASNDAFLNAVKPDQLAESLKYFSPFPVVINGKDYYTFTEVRNAIKLLGGMIAKLEIIDEKRQVLVDNLTTADTLMTEVENQYDGRLDDLRVPYEEQVETINYLTTEGGVTRKGALFAADEVDRSFKRPRPEIPTNPTQRIHQYYTAFAGEFGLHHIDYEWGFDTPTWDKQNADYNSGALGAYWVAIAKIVDTYYDDAYGPASTRWFFGAGGEIDNDDTASRNKLRSASRVLINNIKQQIPNEAAEQAAGAILSKSGIREAYTSEKIQEIGGLENVPENEGLFGDRDVDGMFWAWSGDVTPFADLRQALLDFSITYITGKRAGTTFALGGTEVEDDDIVASYYRTIPSELEARRKDLELANLQVIYTGGTLTTGGLSAIRDQLEEFLENNDDGEWEDT